MSKIILITGGVRSGKSEYANKLAASGKGKVVYIATAEALDSDMKKRIALHRKRRDRSWQTIEEPIYVSAAIKKIRAKKPVIILDCLTLLLSNLIHKGLSDSDICDRVKAILKSLALKASFSIIVTNEVGSGIIPDNSLARRFRDLQGRINQFVAEKADRVYFLVSGIPVKLK